MAIITIAEAALVETIGREKEGPLVVLLMSLTRKKLKKKVKSLKLSNKEKKKNQNNLRESPLMNIIETRVSRLIRLRLLERSSQSKKARSTLSGSKRKSWKSSKPRKIKRLLKITKRKAKSKRRKKRTPIVFPPALILKFWVLIPRHLKNSLKKQENRSLENEAKGGKTLRKETENNKKKLF